MIDELKAQVLEIKPLELPVIVSDLWSVFRDRPELERLPFIDGEELKAVYLWDIVPLLLGCQNGRMCKDTLPPSLLKDIPRLDIGAPEKTNIEAIKQAMVSETSMALMMGDLFYGMVPLRRLVDFVHRHEIKEAITVSPLTGLPGNFSIEREFVQKVESGDSFVVCHVDINDFKAYNDAYGIAKGDDVIKFTGNLLCELCPDCFVGHVGGDDFVLFLPIEKADETLGRVTDVYDARVGAFYNQRHRVQGYIVSKDRRGRLCKFPLMAVAIAARPVTEQENYTSVAMALAELKKFVKKKSKEEGGSRYAFDKRGAASADGHSGGGDGEEGLGHPYNPGEASLFPD